MMEEESRAQAFIEAGERISSAARINYVDLLVDHAQGALVYDADGKAYIDLLASASTANVGHCHPQVVAAIQEQAEHLLHYIPSYSYQAQLEALAERLAGMTPGHFEKKVSFSTSGSEANEAIIKFARAYTGRPYLISFTGAYHGSSYGAMTLSACSLNMRRKMGPLLPGVYHMPYPDPYRRRPGESDDQLAERYLDAIRLAFETYLAPEEVACVLIEPIQGDAGIIIPPQAFMQGLYELCQEHGILFAVDEINQGLGRSGKLWGIDHFGLTPDLMAIGKSLASGLPLSALVGRAEILESLGSPGHAFTSAGNPVCVAAAHASLDVIEEENLVQKSEEDGRFAQAAFQSLQSKYPQIIGDVRCLGLNAGIELVTDPETKERDSQAASKIMTYLFDHGVLMVTLMGNVLRFQPPLVISRELLTQAFAVLDQAFAALEAGEIQLPDHVDLGW
ncbi:aspartate aminotransferase family protein [Aerococcus sanguinicola]|nr:MULTISPECIES: aspartate aminotransferase family protein [unclassified Aerococcus]MDK6233392.1 aspartate aminotransferase family protein [Aerococcus sp. UMB10185]MDK6805019.1 aspartate aminotransferase family protein [Aerococcus sp. UMB7834]MDK6855221.1 aspartate aminotransferase family protein [Aerococcus sp. UMB7533]MDK8501865.1 aspartate aminotransferase family protein [Aerococcus sp. UMB1112A]OFN04402.1 4-aminobutyrate aminotransferase [Aerococcus sp. HMSC062A02]